MISDDGSRCTDFTQELHCSRKLSAGILCCLMQFILGSEN